MGMLNPWNNEEEKVRKPSPQKKEEEEKVHALYKKCGSVCSFATEVHFICRDFKISPLCLYCEKAKMLSE